MKGYNLHLALHEHEILILYEKEYNVTDLRLSSAPPTTTMLLSARSFSLNSSMPSVLHCRAFWPTTNNTGVFMSSSGSSTSCKPVAHRQPMSPWGQSPAFVEENKFKFWQKKKVLNQTFNQKGEALNLTPLGPLTVCRGKPRHTTAVRYSIRDTCN